MDYSSLSDTELDAEAWKIINQLEPLRDELEAITNERLKRNEATLQKLDPAFMRKSRKQRGY